MYLTPILCTILSQVIGILAKDESFNLHDRKKRLIDRSPNENKAVTIQEIPYIINFQKNGLSICGGSILEDNIILTAAHCVREQGVTYSVLSDSPERNDGIHHRVIEILKHPLFSPYSLHHDLALLVIFPPINFTNSHNRRINLYNGRIRANTPATFSGWGCIHITQNGTKIFPDTLRTITVPIMKKQECYDIYRNITEIGDDQICTRTGDEYGEKGSCFGDSGGPLVVNSHLVGVMSWSRGEIKSREHPDVFVNLVHPPYTYWVTSSVQHLRRIHIF